ncbi:MAG: serine hydrolase domain-containing protein [Microbacteriaceae bacterium]
MLATALEASKAVGAQLALATPGGVVTATGGIRSIATREPMTEDTVMQVGSFAKVFTATLVHQLVDDGLVDLRAPIGEYLGEESPDVGDRVTLEQVLSMSSGLDFGFYPDHGLDAHAVHNHVATLRRAPVMFPPGARFAYSGAGIVLAARVAERMRGQSWDDLVRERIIGPAGLVHTETDPLRFPFHPFAPGHEVGPSGVARVVPRLDHLRGTGPNGTTLVSTAADLARFAAVMALGSGSPLLTPAGVARMHAPVAPLGAAMIADHWCTGPYVRHLDDGTAVYGHGGRWTAGVCDVVWAPALDFALATVTNTPDRAGELVLQVRDLLLAELLPAGGWERPTPIADRPLDPARYLGRYRSPSAVYVVDTAHTGELRLTGRRRTDPDEPYPSAGETRIIRPLGGDRFLPEHADAIETPLQEVWFSPGGDRAEFVYEGLLAARRVG